MRLLFITNKFPPISCGVGDYTYKLAQSLVMRGVDVSVLCTYSIEIKENIKAFSEEHITVHPLMKTWNYQELIGLKNSFKIDQFDVVSLQFVPFAFHKRGLPFGLEKGLKNLFSNVQWHIMFHELWVGMEKDVKLTSRVHGILQKKIINNLLKSHGPKMITTNTSVYKFQIKKLGYEAKQLPLFSNIIKNDSKKESNSEDKLIFALFGNIHHGAPVENFISELIGYVDSIGKSTNEIKFLFLGRCGMSINDWTSVLKKKQIAYEITGKISESKISEFLLNSHFGVTTTPFILAEKSGTVATMLQHNLRIISVSRSWDVTGFNKSQFSLQNSVQYYEEGNLDILLHTEVNLIYNDVDKISDIYLNFLNYKH